MSACGNLEVVGRGIGAGAGRLGENVYKMTQLSLVCTPEWAVFRDSWRGFISGQTTNPMPILCVYKTLIITFCYTTDYSIDPKTSVILRFQFPVYC